jgi:hypothetical protein
MTQETRERKALKELIRMVSSGKTVIVEPDIGCVPYTLCIECDGDMSCHTQSSFFSPDYELTEDNIDGYVDSLINHLCQDGPGLSWHCEDTSDIEDDSLDGRCLLCVKKLPDDVTGLFCSDKCRRTHDQRDAILDVLREWKKMDRIIMRGFTAMDCIKRRLRGVDDDFDFIMALSSLERDGLIEAVDVRLVKFGTCAPISAYRLNESDDGEVSPID